MSPQFERAGVYAILLDGRIVYIGKSFNMLARMAQHYAGIQMQAERKYRVLAEATRHGHKMCFTVLYVAKASSHAAIEEEIGQKEGELIRQHLPPLNT